MRREARGLLKNPSRGRNDDGPNTVPLSQPWGHHHSWPLVGLLHGDGGYGLCPADLIPASPGLAQGLALAGSSVYVLLFF